MNRSKKKIDELCINTIKILSIDAIEKAKSGHPGAPMGLAAAGYVLWTKILKHNPNNPDWQNRDRFILSGGHASILLYNLLYLTGYNLSLNDIKKFRQIGSKTPGHPEYGQTVGVETTTGPLGQGIANGVGMAIAEKHLAAYYNKEKYKIIDNYTYVFCGDGDLMEGISSEAASIAGHLSLSKLICVYDSNGITIEGETSLSFTEDISSRFKSYNWQVILVENGNDTSLIEKAYLKAKNEKEKPSIIILKTHIADGSPNLQDNPKAHGAPLGEKETKLTKRNLNWPENKNFFIPNEVLSHCRKSYEKGIKEELAWLEQYKSYAKKFPKPTESWLNSLTRFLPNDWDSEIPKFNKYENLVATRTASGLILNSIANKIPSLIGGSADLAPSNKTYIKNSCDFQKNSYIGKNIRFGVREFAMGAILSGIFLNGGLRPYGGTFLVFSDYMRPAIRLASIMNLPIIYLFTHDSIAVGEDGPTHQPIEHLSSLRIIPRLIVIRPADANETSEAWRIAILSEKNPVAIILSRQKLPILKSEKIKIGVKKGAYILSDSNEKFDVIMISTGSEVHLVLKAKKILEKNKIFARVVSMPSWELFEKQSQNYKENVLPSKEKNIIAVEAGTSTGWERYIGKRGMFIGLNDFGISGPGKEVMNRFGIEVNNIVKKTINFLKKTKN